MARAVLSTENLRKAFDDAAGLLRKKDPTRTMSLAALLQQVGDNVEDDVLVLGGIVLGQFAAAITQLSVFAPFDTSGGLTALVESSLKTGADLCSALGKEICGEGPVDPKATLATAAAFSRLNLRLLNRLQLVQQVSQLGPPTGGAAEG